jgi:3-methyladenine DNA glycosylase/8-oxoguanine DNA glycosylase/O6-methylguanine-DNA--protein-cysteine methyltransferase
MAFALLDTPLGPAAVEWSNAGVTRLVFERKKEVLLAGLAARGAVEGQRPPRFVREAISRLQAHLLGKLQDFASIPLDFAGSSPLLRDVEAALRDTRAGATVDAEALAARLAMSGGSARLRRLLARNPVPVFLPGHRVLGAGGLLGAWGGGEAIHERLLVLESMGRARLYTEDGLPDSARVEEALAHLRAVDPRLGELIERVGPYRLSLRQGHSPYEALARSIVGQQITGRAAQAILARLALEFGTAGVHPPERIRRATDAKLRAAGLSGGKARAFRDLAAHALAGGVPSWAILRRWPDERILSTLTEIHGIGRWTVQMVLLFRLGRPDVLPLGDYGVRKGYGRTFARGRLPSLRELQRRGWRWRPFRSVASWYLWRALELP